MSKLVFHMLYFYKESAPTLSVVLQQCHDSASATEREDMKDSHYMTA